MNECIPCAFLELIFIVKLKKLKVFTTKSS